jgi:small subunit ribosomal protein S1
MSQESFAELFEESIKSKQMNPGDIVTGAVVGFEKDYVLVSVGLKSDGVIPRQQFANHAGEVEINVGDEVDVVIEMLEDGFGETRLSREKAKRAVAWRSLEQSHDKKETIQGFITGKVKGGFTVELEGGVRAFLPGSLVDVRPVRDSSYLEGKEIDFKVIKMDQKRNNVVVSRRAVVEEEMSGDRDSLLETMEEGQEIKGVVKNLTDYGAFVDLGGVDGLLHITDMSWKRIKHPSEVVAIGDEINVKVLKFDREKGRVSLGLKQLGDDPWFSLAERYPSGATLIGRVTNLTDYGCFVEIENGIEGLLHMSEMDWTNKNIHPSKVVQLGDEVKVMVLEIDESRRRISLGMKQCIDNPWDAFAKLHQVGGKVKGPIKSITDFGVFIGLEGNIDGLIHLSDISAEKPGEEAVHDLNKGDEIEAVILGVDPSRERISLGIKQVHMDAFEVYLDTHSKGGVIEATVTEKNDQGAKVELQEGVSAELASTDIEGDINVGDTVKVRIVEVDIAGKLIIVSMKAPTKRAKKSKASETSVGDGGKATLGDLLKAKMEDKDED